MMRKLGARSEQVGLALWINFHQISLYVNVIIIIIIIVFALNLNTNTKDYDIGAMDISFWGPNIGQGIKESNFSEVLPFPALFCIRMIIILNYFRVL